MDLTLVLVTLLSLALAAVMTVLAWRLAREERRRSDARVAALAAELRIERDRDLPLHHVAPVVTSHDLFNAPRVERSFAPPRAAAAVVAAVAVASCAAFLWFFTSHTSVSARSTRTPAGAAQAEPAAALVPLELTALTHERGADSLTVRGIVRNPGAGIRGLTAVVFLFDREGGFVTSGRATIDDLPSGTESPFSVTIPRASEVGRYRVSFRTNDRIVPHLDRRDRSLAQAK
jgi:hypothetical protein